ncbi:MAG: hypothetical protein COB53_08665 [Elusimicrobia bacterium]|nr:MAG: hypothetical protein COB53_08665 [Elusimicrobiota bacterium]
MRWWLYDGKKTVGPFSKEDLARLQVFSPNIALCREYLLATPHEEWFRAVDIKEVAGIFPPGIRSKAEAEKPEGKPGPWPPDPSGRDIDPLYNVGKRMEIVDTILAAAQDRITMRNERFHKLQTELDRRLHIADALEDKIQHMAVKMGGLRWVQDELDHARAAMAMQQKKISDLDEQMEKLEKEQAEAVESAKTPPESTASEEEKPGRRKRRTKRRRARRTSSTKPAGPDPFGFI